MPLTPPAAEGREPLPDIPFQEGEDDYAQLPDLSPEQTRLLIERVSVQEHRP